MPPPPPKKAADDDDDASSALLPRRQPLYATRHGCHHTLILLTFSLLFSANILGCITRHYAIRAGVY